MLKIIAILHIEDSYSAIAKRDIQAPKLESKFVASGWPAASDDYADRAMNLHDYLISQPAATYFMRIGSREYEREGILKNDLLIVDRSITAVAGKLVIAVIDGALTIRRVVRVGGQLALAGERPVAIGEPGTAAASVWGVIAHIVRTL